MLKAETEERSRTDGAFESNLLLATLKPQVRALLEPTAEIVELGLGERVQSRGSDVEWSYFPLDTAMISLVVQLSGGRSVEVASIGHEGAVGGIVSCGRAPAFADARVQVPGPAVRVSLDALEQAKVRYSFVNNLFCRYSDFLLAQVQQSVACNAFHSIEQRTARWLLTAQDRAGPRIELTQEALAGLLGVQRTTLNAVVRALQEQGLVEVRRGRIVVRDRDRLERHACECYAALERHFAAVLGPDSLV